jgi:hypothetical protein
MEVYGHRERFASAPDDAASRDDALKAQEILKHFITDFTPAP